MPKQEYMPVTQQEVDEGNTIRTSAESSKPYSDKRRIPLWICVAVLFLLFFNGIQLSFLGFFFWQGEKSQRTSDENSHPGYAIHHEVPSMYKKFWWNTEYSSTNQTHQNELWDSIVWTHGMIAMDREWAKSKNWPNSMALPGDPSKDVYLLEAYHEIHCLKVLRQIMEESLSGVDFANDTTTHAHVAHCFDYLIQMVTCSADSLPLNTFGGTYVGNGEIHKCKDWNALRDFAAENSACYKEIEGVSLDDHFGHCDNGDGLV